MKRIETPERASWQAKAEELGFIFHTMYGEPYWDETHYYEFTLRQIEDDIEDPSTELHQMCLQAVDYVLNSADRMEKLAIPRTAWDYIAHSWDSRQPHLYGRFDFAYDANGPAKLLEYNADTPTSLYESAFFQWVWLEDKIASGDIPADCDQFNSMQEVLIARFAEMFAAGSHVHFAAASGSDEDRQTVKYLEDCAAQAGLNPYFVLMDDIGITEHDEFTDKDGILIQNLFKLYPWEDMLREDFATHVFQSPVTFVEPGWKSILSNKGLMPILWEMFEGHPNLLPAYFEGEEPSGFRATEHVRKPLYSREGANVEVYRGGGAPMIAPGDYGAEGFILQSYATIPEFRNRHVVVGSWMIGDTACGIGLREDTSIITRDSSRFIPHVIRG